MSRDDFSKSTIETLAKRVNYHCSNPGCRRPTSGPNTESDKATNIGVAAHIKAASPGGKRYDPNQSPEERSSIENGIWLCQDCAKLIDSDEQRYTVYTLHDWKNAAEKSAQQAIEKPGLSTGKNDQDQDFPASNYPVDLSINYKREKTTSNEHDYLLQITVTNKGSRKIEEMLIEIEIPSLLKKPNHIYSTEVKGRSTRDRMFLRYHEKKAQNPIFPGDTLTLAIPYRVDHNIYWHHRYIFEEVVKVFVSIQDGFTQILEKRIEELQCF